MLTHDLSEEFILSEVKKLQYLYTLKKEIRYGQKRPLNDLTESVAEHLYGMHLVAQYFLPIEDPQNNLDKSLVFEMILFHDIDEIETGDTIGYLKNDINRADEISAQNLVITNSPQHLQETMRQVTSNYQIQTSKEAKFVKAVDRFEPLIQIYSDFGREVNKINKTTAEQSVHIKEPYLNEFPAMYAFYKVIHQKMIEENFFTT